MARHTYLFVYLGAPPMEVLYKARIYESEENSQQAKREARVKGSGESHSILTPPRECTAGNDEVEDEVNQRPAREV